MPGSPGQPGLKGREPPRWFTSPRGQLQASSFSQASLCAGDQGCGLPASQPQAGSLTGSGACGGLARQATVPAPIFCSQHHFLNVTLGLVRGAEPYGTSQAGNPQAAVAPGGYAVCHELQATSPLPIITDALGTNLQPHGGPGSPLSWTSAAQPATQTSSGCPRSRPVCGPVHQEHARPPDPVCSAQETWPTERAALTAPLPYDLMAFMTQGPGSRWFGGCPRAP